MLGIDQFVIMLLITEIISVILIGNQAMVILCRPVDLIDQGEDEHAEKDGDASSPIKFHDFQMFCPFSILTGFLCQKIFYGFGKRGSQ